MLLERKFTYSVGLKETEVKGRNGRVPVAFFALRPNREAVEGYGSWLKANYPHHVLSRHFRGVDKVAAGDNLLSGVEAAVDDFGELLPAECLFGKMWKAPPAPGWMCNIPAAFGEWIGLVDTGWAARNGVGLAPLNFWMLPASFTFEIYGVLMSGKDG